MEVKIYRSKDELEQIRAFWVANEHHPNSSFHHFLLVCELRKEVISPLVVAVWERGSVTGLIAGRLESSSIIARVGYARLIKIQARVLTVINAGVIGKMDWESAKATCKKLEAMLSDGLADLVSYSLVREEHPLRLVLAQSKLRTLGCRNPAWSRHWELKLAPERGFLLKAMRSKHRSWINRKEKELESRFTGQVRWVWQSTFSDLEGLCAKMESVACTTYQRGLGAGFVNDGQFRARLGLFAKTGRLRVMLLEIGGNPKAFWFGELEAGTFHSSATGYTPDMREFEVGTLMFIRMVDELVGDGATTFDFGLGDAHYKERFGDNSWRESGIRMFAPTVKGRLLGWLLTSTDVIERALRYLVERAGVLNRVKRAWRDRLKLKS